MRKSFIYGKFSIPPGIIERFNVFEGLGTVRGYTVVVEIIVLAKAELRDQS